MNGTQFGKLTDRGVESAGVECAGLKRLGMQDPDEAGHPIRAIAWFYSRT
jgi:hypothetical protein